MKEEKRNQEATPQSQYLMSSNTVYFVYKNQLEVKSREEKVEFNGLLAVEGLSSNLVIC